jgi:hypothetical protein
VFADAVARWRALERLREFRSRLYDCLALRADALFELTDAILCADHAVTSLVRVCLEPEFTRGHGALYDALSAGRIDDERLFSLLTAVLTPLADGPQARSWIAGHDVIDHALLEKSLAGVPARDAARVRDGCARWSRLRFAVDATAYPRPDAVCSPGREHVHHGACRCKGSSKTTPGWEYQFIAAIGHLRTAWAAFTDAARTTPATRTEQTVAQVQAVLRRLRAAGHGHRAAPLFLFDAGYSAAALTDGLAGCPAHILVRLAAGSVFYADAVTGDGKNGRPARRGPAVHCLEPADFAADTGKGPRGRTKALPPNPEPDEELLLPDTPLYGTVRAGAWHHVHPLVHGDRGWFAGRTHLPVLHGTLIHLTVERLPDGRDPHRAMWPWHAGPGPLSPDELWRAYLARFDIEHAFKILKGTLGPHRRQAPRPRTGRPLGEDRHGRPCPAPARPAPGRRPAPPLGTPARPRPAPAPRTGPPGVSQHPPRARHPGPCRETHPPRTRQAQRQQQRPSTPPPAPRRSRHAAHHEHDADQAKG